MARSLEMSINATSNVSDATGKAAKEAEKLAKKLKEAFDFKGALTSAFVSAFGAAALLDKAITTVTDSFKEMADIADQSQKAGISAQEFDKLAFAANDAGVSTGVLSKSIRELRFMMKDALTDTKKMTLLTEGLGFAEEDVRAGKVKTIELFQRVAQAIATQENDTNKLAIATAFFGDKVANDMLPVLEAIAKNPDIFKGLITGSEQAYKSIDELDTRLSKLWHNIKRVIGEAISSQDEFFKNAKEAGLTKEQAQMFHSALGLGSDMSILGAINAQDAANNAYKNADTPAQAQASKVNADAILSAQQKTTDNTIANSLGASMGNAPTSGVIGVGNNAQLTLLENQLDTLKAIKDSIDNLKPANVSQTDFTKQSSYPL